MTNAAAGVAPAIDLPALAARLADMAAGLAPGGRVLVGLAGAPGSGKSTTAETLAGVLNAQADGMAAVLPMDGFHYDDLHLVPAGLRARKGAPDTFDVGGFRSMLDRMRRNDEPFVAVPVFDRDIEIARAGARMIPRSVRVLIVEGNYVLLSQEPWASLRPLFDLAVLIDVPEAELRRRLRARWEHYRLTPDEIAWKLDGNDLPNGRMVMAGSTSADLRLVQA